MGANVVFCGGRPRSRRAEAPADHLEGSARLPDPLNPPARRRLAARPRSGPGRGLWPASASARRPAPVDRSARPASPRGQRPPLDAPRTARPRLAGPMVRSRHRQAKIALCHRRWLHARGTYGFLRLPRFPAGADRTGTGAGRDGRAAGSIRLAVSRGTPGDSQNAERGGNEYASDHSSLTPQAMAMSPAPRAESCSTPAPPPPASRPP